MLNLNAVLNFSYACEIIKTVVFNFIPKNSSSKGECGIAPNMWNELMDESISDSIPDGLYARIEYIKDSGIKIPKAIMNIVSYEV